MTDDDAGLFLVTASLAQTEQDRDGGETQCGRYHGSAERPDPPLVTTGRDLTQRAGRGMPDNPSSTSPSAKCLAHNVVDLNDYRQRRWFEWARSVHLATGGSEASRQRCLDIHGVERAILLSHNEGRTYATALDIRRPVAGVTSQRRVHLSVRRRNNAGDLLRHDRPRADVQGDVWDNLAKHHADHRRRRAGCPVLSTDRQEAEGRS